MKHLLWQRLFICGICGLNSLSVSWADVPQQPSYANVSDQQLIVEKRLGNGSLEEPQSYIIKGVTWSAATRAPAEGPHPDNQGEEIPYGFFFNWPGREPQGHELLAYWKKTEFKKHYIQDISLMREMNVNTVRVYEGFGDDYEVILDEFYRNNIMVIATVAISKDDFKNDKYLDMVEQYKNHPAILMWSLGNEWNFNRYYCDTGDCSMDNLIEITNLAARKIKEIDPHHPVSSSLGDRFDLSYDPDDPCSAPPEKHSDIPWIVAHSPSIDVWGINGYRGDSFGNLFYQWEEAWGKEKIKPFYLSEFGTDSFRSSSYHVPYPCSGLARVDDGWEDQNEQSNIFLSLWNEITNQFSTVHPDGLCLGGLVHEFNDELWKAGNSHAGLGDPDPVSRKFVDYDGADASAYAEYNTQGFNLKGSHSDEVANEEYFGVVDAERNPKEVFYEIQRSFNSYTAKAEEEYPLIKSIQPKEEKPGRKIKIEGENFGRKGILSNVYFYGQKVTFVKGRRRTWKDRYIIVKVPDLPPGEYLVQVRNRDWLRSNFVPFEIKKKR